MHFRRETKGRGGGGHATGSGPGLHVVDQVVHLLPSFTCVSCLGEEDEAGKGGEDESRDRDEVGPVQVIEAGI